MPLHSPSVNTFHDPPPALRLTTDPVPYELAPINLTDAKTRRYRDWVDRVASQQYLAIYCYVLSRTEHDSHLSADVTQEAFLDLLVKFDEPFDWVRPWLFKRARMLIWKHFWTASNKVKIRRFADRRSERDPIIVSREGTPLQNAQYRELKQEVDAAIEKRPDSAKRMLSMKVYDGARIYQIMRRSESLEFHNELRRLKYKFRDYQPANKAFKLRIAAPPEMIKDRSAYDLWCVDLNRKFNSVKEAATEFGVARCSISFAANGHSMTSAGHRWEWRLRPEGKKPRSPEWREKLRAAANKGRAVMIANAAARKALDVG